MMGALLKKLQLLKSLQLKNLEVLRSPAPLFVGVGGRLAIKVPRDDAYFVH